MIPPDMDELCRKSSMTLLLLYTSIRRSVFATLDRSPPEWSLGAAATLRLRMVSDRGG